MLERKFTSFLEHFLMEEPNKILLVNGARQIGKSYLIRYVGQKLFAHFVEINLKEVNLQKGKEEKALKQRSSQKCQILK